MFFVIPGNEGCNPYAQNLRQEKMGVINPHQYYIYIVTNAQKKALYTGVTNNLNRRITEHWLNRGKDDTFAGKYHCYNLIYFENFQYINLAIVREKEIKGWRRQKKIDLIATTNPSWAFLNISIFGSWPPYESKSDAK